ncbi:MAG: GNAT family N-acetyltransferase [Burkholderiales bacterium]|nr:GNAT family N-acetyltransferase [Burkholderiales bacterium]
MSVDAGVAGTARFLRGHDRTLLSRLEDAGLNASAPPQQRWMDGWLVRTCPGKAQRARCINAVAVGRRPVAEKLAEARALYRALHLPLLVRITPFTQPPDLEEQLEAAGFAFHDDTRVMSLARIDPAALGAGALPAGTAWAEVTPAVYAEAVGGLRGSSPEARRAHAERLLSSPVPYRGFVLSRDGAALACGQIAQESDLVGLYDIATAAGQQRQGLGTWLCKRLLTIAASDGSSRSAYLQVGAENEAARRVYRRLGFTDAYTYHYRAEAVAA